MDYFRGVEPQDGARRDDGQGRGALHAHVMFWANRRLGVEELQQWALAAGFGCVIHLSELAPGPHSYYCSKYVTKGSWARDEVPWMRDVVDEGTGEVRRLRSRATYRTWSRSQGWGVSMAAVRHSVRVWARERAAALRAEGVDQVVSVDPGPGEGPGTDEASPPNP